MVDISLLDESTFVSLNQAKQLFGRIPEVMEVLAPMRDAFDGDAPSIELAVLLDRWTSRPDSSVSVANPIETEWPAARKHLKRKAATSREPLNPALRFAILKRDGYRCQLCGATASAGVRLEVDHRVAVNRGGPTTAENLWTLCFACNRGKRERSL